MIRKGRDAMSCTRHFLNFEWQHHVWRRRVSSTESLTGRVTDMWGRRVDSERVRCYTERVCDACGEVRPGGDCLCEMQEAERCAVRLACIEASCRGARSAP